MCYIYRNRNRKVDAIFVCQKIGRKILTLFDECVKSFDLVKGSKDHGFIESHGICAPTHRPMCVVVHCIGFASSQLLRPRSCTRPLGDVDSDEPIEQQRPHGNRFDDGWPVNDD